MSIGMLDGKTVKKIYVVPYSHHDFAWVCTRNWHLERYIKSFSEVLEVMNERQDFTWCIDNVHHSWLPFARYCPAESKAFAQRIKEGRICVANGGYSLARPSYVGEETYIRNLIAGRRYFQEQFGLQDIPTLFNADTACGHSQMPQIAKLSGHTHYRFQRSDVMLTKKKIPLQFHWKGLDGSEVLVSRGVYGSLWALNEWMQKDFDTEWEEIRQAFYDNWLSDKVIDDLPTENVILFLGSDDSRPLRDAGDKPLRFNEFMEAWNRKEPVKMEYITMDGFFEALEQQALPTYEGVLDHAELSYNIPLKGDRSMWRLRLELDHLLVEVERTAVIASQLGWTYPEEEIASLWKSLFEITGHAIEYIMAKDHDHQYTIADGARLRALALLRDARDYIAAAMPQESAIQAVVVNTLNWPVTQPVRFEVSTYDGIGGFDLYDSRNNKLDYQVVDILDGYNVHEGQDHVSVEVLVNLTVPATGCTSVRAVPNGRSLKEGEEKTFIDNLPACPPPDSAERVSFDNGRLRVVFYKGRLIEMTDIKSGRSLRAETDRDLAALKFCQLTPEVTWISNFTPVARYEFLPEKGKILQNGPARFQYRVYGTIAGQPAEVAYSLDQDSAGLDIAVETNFRDAIEGVLTWTVAADSEGEIYADIPFGTEKREFFDELFVHPETGERLYPAPQEQDFPGQIYGRNWCAFEYKGVPVSLVSQNCSVYYLLEKEAGTMSLFLNRHMPLKYRTDRWVGKSPDSYDGVGKNHYCFSMLMNEKTGCSTDIQRYHKTRIFPISAMNRLGNCTVPQKAEDLSLLCTDRDNIIGTALYRENGRLYARFFECEGSATAVSITVPQNVSNIRSVDFEGKEQDTVLSYDEKEHTVKVDFGKYQIITLEMSLGG